MEYIVYVKIDFNNYITAINSSEFLTNTEDWVEIDHGYGDKYYHAQGNYFSKSIYTDSGVYRYKLVNNIPIECTEEEIAQQEEINKPVNNYTAQDDTDAMLIDHEYRLTLLELNITE